MTFDEMLRDYRLSRDFELETWAEDQHKKIAATVEGWKPKPRKKSVEELYNESLMNAYPIQHGQNLLAMLGSSPQVSPWWQYVGIPYNTPCRCGGWMCQFVP